MLDADERAPILAVAGASRIAVARHRAVEQEGNQVSYPDPSGGRRYPRTMADPRKETVRAGYDLMAGRFGEWASRVKGDPRDRFLHEFLELMPRTGSVLDPGCGAGVPSTKRLAGRSA